MGYSQVLWGRTARNGKPVVPKKKRKKAKKPKKKPATWQKKTVKKVNPNKANPRYKIIREKNRLERERRAKNRAARAIVFKAPPPPKVKPMAQTYREKVPKYMTPIIFTGKQFMFLVEVLIREKEQIANLTGKMPELNQVYMSDIKMCNKLIRRLILLEPTENNCCYKCKKVQRKAPVPEGNLQQLYTGYKDPKPYKCKKKEGKDES